MKLDDPKMEELRVQFNKAYEEAKRLGFLNYFCMSKTTWKEAYENLNVRGLVPGNEAGIKELELAINAIIHPEKVDWSKVK